MEDLTGKQFGKWKVLQRDTNKYKTRNIRWICECECGTIKSVLGKNLLNGESTSCGCSLKVDCTGRRYGKLTVLETLYNYKGNKRAVCKCLCECGNISYIKAAELPKRKTCGCSKEPVVGGKIKDITGQTFGKLTVLEIIPRYKNHEAYCKCICECGTEVMVRKTALVTGNTKSCGCISSPSLLGQRFGRLTVVEEVPSDTRQRKWKCLCDCGCYNTLTTHTLTSGHTLSCGCIRSNNVSTREQYISDYLKKQNIAYEKEYVFDDCRGKRGYPLRFDFYLPDYKTLIEYDGAQHYRPIDYFGGEEAFIRLKENDEVKNKYCIDNNLNLKRIPYTYSFQEIDNVINEIIQIP